MLEALDPTTPAPGEGPGDSVGVAEPGLPAPTVAAAQESAATPPASTVAAGAGSPPSTALSTPTTAVGAGDDSTHAPPTGLPSSSPPGATVPASSSAGSGGAHGATHVRPSDANTSPLRAGERTPGATDDALPSSPVADTDVSPD